MAAFALLAAAVSLPLLAAEHITLRNGFDLICDHREASGDRVRLYMTAPAVRISWRSRPPTSRAASSSICRHPNRLLRRLHTVPAADPTPAEIREMAGKAGAAHDLDVDLLASVIRAESNGNVHAVSHAGALGLMQLMPGTASKLGVADSFRADQNINGGTAYLNALLMRYQRQPGAGARGVQRWSGCCGPVSRHSAVPRDAPIRRTHHPRLQSAQGRSCDPRHHPGCGRHALPCRQLSSPIAKASGATAH